MKKIAILLPWIPMSPIGGYKVVYEYANRLVQDGCDVNIYYPSYIFYNNKPWYIRILGVCKAILRFIYCNIWSSAYHAKWFALDEKVKERFVWNLSENYITGYDIYVATSVKTAIYLNKYNNTADKYYLIQGYEAWYDITEEILFETYRCSLKKFVISTWIKNIVEKYDPSCILLPNGFDFNFFRRYIIPEQRNKYCIAMLYHENEWKGCKDGFDALKRVKERYPQIKVNLFGVYNKPSELPEWYNYYKSPDKDTFNKIYNESAIFIGTSWSEGWGLTVGEAMACGCAITCTDNDGYLEMVKPNVSALVSPIKSPQTLAENIIRLIEDDNLRYNLANRGYQDIQKFSWDRSYEILKNTFEI